MSFLQGFSFDPEHAAVIVVGILFVLCMFHTPKGGKGGGGGSAS